jgi:hypothetical protein
MVLLSSSFCSGFSCSAAPLTCTAQALCFMLRVAWRYAQAACAPQRIFPSTRVAQTLPGMYSVPSIDLTQGWGSTNKSPCVHHPHRLFVNGQRRQPARSSNTGFYHADGIFLTGNPSRFKFHPGDIHAAGLSKATWKSWVWKNGRSSVCPSRPWTPHQHRHALLRAPGIRR